MKKVIIGLFAFILSLGVCFAETDYIAMEWIQKLMNGSQEFEAVAVTGGATVGGDLTVQGSPVSVLTVLSAPTVGSDYVLTNRTPLAVGEMVYSVSNVVSAATGTGTTGTVGVAVGETVNDWIILK